MKLIDTDMAIDHFHGHRPALDHLTERLADGETLVISVVTVTELLSGLRPGEEERTERLFKLFSIQDINDTIARKAGDYLRQYRRDHNIGLGDALIAATVAFLGAELVTRNAKHYPITDISITIPYERGKRN